MRARVRCVASSRANSRLHINRHRLFREHCVHVEGSFVKDLPGQEHSRTIVNAIVALAHGLGLHITAEGVETPEQADYLVRQGCDVLQGYLFARPMPVQALEALLLAQPHCAAA